MSFIKKHKLLMVIIIVILLVISVFMFILKDFIFSLGNGNPYGNRLDGINEVVITDSNLNDIASEIKKSDNVTDCTYNVTGKLVNFIITIDGDLEIETSRELALNISDNFSDEINSFYDIEVFIETKKESDMYPIIGYKHKTSDTFMWTYFNEGEEDEE